MIEGRRIIVKLGRFDRPEVEDLTHEALVRALRAVRRSPVLNPAGLLTRIADRTVIDHIRKRTRGAILCRLDDHDRPELPAPEPGEEVSCEELERFRFLVLEFLRENDLQARRLAEAYFAGRAWSEVAAELGKSPAAVRKQWSRVVGTLRSKLRGLIDPETAARCRT